MIIFLLHYAVKWPEQLSAHRPSEMVCVEDLSFPVFKSLAPNETHGSDVITRRSRPPSSGHLHLPSRLSQSFRGEEKKKIKNKIITEREVCK